MNHLIGTCRRNVKKRFKSDRCRGCGCEMTLRESCKGFGYCFCCDAVMRERAEKQHERDFPGHA